MIKRSYIWAGIIALAMVGWLASGDLKARLEGEQAPAPVAAEEAKSSEETTIFRVEVRTFKAKDRRESMTLQGRTEAFKTLDVLARTNGIVEKSPRIEGDLVKVGDLLCELDISDRKARLAQSKAELASATRDFEAAEKLSAKKFVSQAKLASEQARLDAAKAAVEQMELDLAWTQVTAPISGTIAQRPTEQGKYLKVGESCAVITVLDPIIAVGQVNERMIGAMSVGAPAQFTLLNGAQFEGKIRFIAPQADNATRTFRIEGRGRQPG